MSFLKDFKNEISQAVNELVSSDNVETEFVDSEYADNRALDEKVLDKKASDEKASDQKISYKKASDEKASDKKISYEKNLDEDTVEEIDSMARRPRNGKENTKKKNTKDFEELDDTLESNLDMESFQDMFSQDMNLDSDVSFDEDNSFDESIDDEMENELARELSKLGNTDPDIDDEISAEFDSQINGDNSDMEFENIEYEEKHMSDFDKEAAKAALRGEQKMYSEDRENKEEEAIETSLASEDVAEVTKGTMIDGNIISEGSMNVYGKIKGNVACRGKLSVSGTIIGASRAAEIFTSNAKIDGDVTSDGTIKIGNGSVIIGNVYGSSAVIAGAVKGDVDVNGPVVVDGTAVIQGNIRSRSVQINNGAAIEGMVSQCYAEIDYVALFDKTFAK